MLSLLDSHLDHLLLQLVLLRNFYFNDGIEIIDTFGYPSVDTEFEQSLDVPRLCLVDNPDKRISCAFAKKMQLEIERAEKLLEE